MLRRRLQLVFLIVFSSGCTKYVKGLFVALISEGHVYVTEPGDTVSLECNFHADQYDSFEYPVLWRKTQHLEDSQVNVMGTLMEPFSQRKRFQVTFHAFDSRYRLMLHIHGVTVVDSGNYTCEIRTPEANILGGVTHSLFVRESVDSVVIVLNNITRKSSYTAETQHVKLVEGQPVSVSCTSAGGYPPPQVTVRVGNNDITNTFATVVNQTLLPGNGLGLRYIKHKIHLWTLGYIPTADADQHVLQCSAEVTGLEVVIQGILLNVCYAPKITCHSASAYLDDHNINIRCDIMSNPSVLNFYWTIDSNGTTLKEDETLAEYRTTATVIFGNNTMDIRLFIKKIQVHHFHSYEISATNALGKSSHRVELVQRYKVTAKKSVGGIESDDVDQVKTRQATLYNSALRQLALTKTVLLLQLLTDTIVVYLKTQ